QCAYATVIFIVVRNENDVSIHLLASKARVSPTTKTKKGMTIPRLELLGALIAARLYATVVEDYKLHDVRTIFWTDATTVLAWLLRKEPWDVFVHNRVQEICKITANCEWRHVPGEHNPADLPSRGCTPKKLLQCRWWEGPSWLKEPEERWPVSEVKFDESEINTEKKRTVVSSMICTEKLNWYKYFSKFKQVVNMIGWILRFKNNCDFKKKNGHLPENRKHLSVEEYKIAEEKVFWLCQQDGPLDMDKLKHLSIIPTDNGLIRLKTKISNREDENDFCHPILLPGKHPVVQRLIFDIHTENCHAGTQMLLSILRQRFWITGGRRTIRSILKSCVVCQRFTSKNIQTPAIPLPIDRVRDAKVFEISGVDLAGPLFVKDDKGSLKKVWICLFTCAVYRAVRLELVFSLSTDSFIMALRRFIAKNGRPSIIYSDNGSNFTCFKNVCDKLDWDTIASYSTARKIEWRLIPPSSPWWGGWWERLVGVMKSVLKKILGRACVDTEVLQTILGDCESIMNQRPLTYLSEDPSDLAVLTPAMFLNEIQEVGVPEWELIQPTDLRKRYVHRQELVKGLRERFRTEYLGQLQLFSNKASGLSIKVGDVVLIGDDNVKRIDWPVGLVIELIKGRDMAVRVVRVRTINGVVTRSVQRPNLIEKIPSALAKFRQRKIGVSGDITKAFLQISVAPNDRDFLRFLWQTTDGQLKVFRHCRVLFGASPSPFLLEACINLHIDTTLSLCKEGKSNYSIVLLELLKNSFYVDNCLASVDNIEQAQSFITLASSVMIERGFELRGWEKSGDQVDKTTNVLGLVWDRYSDTLAINTERLSTMKFDNVTKKIMLSAAHRLFDPL
ncbi:uncharacterized protein LOC103521378, partial [Diaphorina citri]|uniref:Uncharacterized protein LOC103521378 n=1 Tax=Diaphorina citri TaxID=121845 RepID=A0A1S3DMX8_DIACI